MSQQNVEFVAGIFDAADGMDKEALIAALPDLGCWSRPLAVAVDEERRSAWKASAWLLRGKPRNQTPC
jgi:hypothetical protein